MIGWQPTPSPRQSQKFSIATIDSDHKMGHTVTKKKILPTALSLSLIVAITNRGAAAEPPDTNYDESKVPSLQLPQLLTQADGTKVTSTQAWTETRRAEVQALLEEFIFGKTPDQRPNQFRSVVIESDPKALGGKATRKQIKITIDPARDLDIDLLVYIPNDSDRPVPCFLGLNFYGNQTVHSDPAIQINPRWMRGNSEIGIRNSRATDATRGVYKERWSVEKLIDRGYAVATAYCGDIDPDNYQHDFADGVHPLFYKPGQTKPASHEWGAIGAWAWGLSRILDYIIEKEASIAKDKVAVIGHSRLGKTALWAGAQDQRFALVISNNSGCGGAALYRREFGERIHHMIKPVGYWFCENHAAFAQREQELPVDQHMLLALVAPRPLYVASASEDLWADPKGEFLAALEATPIYNLFGKQGLPTKEMPGMNQPTQGTIGYHLRKGEHAVTDYDWEQYLRFADHHLNN